MSTYEIKTIGHHYQTTLLNTAVLSKVFYRFFSIDVQAASVLYPKIGLKFLRSWNMQYIMTRYSQFVEYCL